MQYFVEPRQTWKVRQVFFCAACVAGQTLRGAAIGASVGFFEFWVQWLCFLRAVFRSLAEASSSMKISQHSVA